jgi:phosphohistidine swiveling domain-containing protein
MLIGRERNLPVICGVQGLVETMKPLDGQIITMDGLTKFIYQGKRELKAAS